LKRGRSYKAIEKNPKETAIKKPVKPQGGVGRVSYFLVHVSRSRGKA